METQVQSRSADFDLVDVLAIPYRHWKVVGLVAAVVLLAGAGLVLARTDQYEVATLVEIGRSRTQLEAQANGLAGRLFETTGNVSTDALFLESAGTLQARILGGIIPSVGGDIKVDVSIPDRSVGIVRIRSTVPKRGVDAAIAVQKKILDEVVADHEVILESIKTKHALMLKEIELRIDDTVRQIEQTKRSTKQGEEGTLRQLHKRVRTQQEAMAMLDAWFASQNSTHAVFGPALVGTQPVGVSKLALLLVCLAVSLLAGFVSAFLYEGFLEMSKRLRQVPRLAHS